VLAWFFIYFPWGRAAVHALAEWYCLDDTIRRMLGQALRLQVGLVKPGAMDMAVSALFPILLNSATI
jgi:purine nucleoside transport protein